jgi:hypothetical protein
MWDTFWEFPWSKLRIHQSYREARYATACVEVIADVANIDTLPAAGFCPGRTALYE